MATVKEKRRLFVEALESLVSRVGRVCHIWGLDISLVNTGLTQAVRDPGVGTRFASCSHKFKGTRYGRMKQLELAFRDHVGRQMPALVVYEGYAYGRVMHREVLGEASYAVKRSFMRRGDPVLSLEVAPTSLKKYACGRGNKVDKKEMVAVVREEWGGDISNHDEADSYVLARIGNDLVQMAEEFCLHHTAKSMTDKQIRGYLASLDMPAHRREVLFNLLSKQHHEMERWFR